MPYLQDKYSQNKFFESQTISHFTMCLVKCTCTYIPG